MIALETWNPLTVDGIKQLFAGAPFDWCLGGGYAIEQFVGRPLRAHADVDVVIFRDQQSLAWTWLRGWNLYAADPPGTLRPWPEHEYLPYGIHDIWGHRPDSSAWQLQLILQEANSREWFYRRDHRVRGSRESFISRSGGIPCIRVEIQLLYKAHHRRPRDETDFQACLPLLSRGAKEWLRTHIDLLYPKGHPWSDALHPVG